AVAPIQPAPRLHSVPNPLAVPALDGLTNNNSLLGAALSFLLFVFLVAALALLLVSFPLSGLAAGNVTSSVAAVGLTVLVPATIGLAVMRHGLYDIDVFISRAVVYGALAGFITAVYVGIAVGIGTLVGSGGEANL